MAIKVNGELIEDERFHHAFLQLSGGRTPQQVQNSPLEYHGLLRQAEQTVLRSVLLHQLAISEGLSATPEEVDEKRRSAWGSAANQSCGTGVTEDVRRDLLIQKAEQLLTRHVQRPDRRDVESIYRHNPRTFTLPERWLVSHIVRLAEDETELSSAEVALTLALQELMRGKAFAQVADRHSDCKGNGGSLGWISQGSMVAEFETVVFAMPLRSVSPIFRTPFGLHIATVQAYKPAGVQPFDDVRSDLARRIFEERKQQHVDRVLIDLNRRARIEVCTEPQRSVAEGEKVS